MMVEEIMVRNVITLSPEEKIARAVDILSENKISGAPVLDGNKLVGIFTEADILKKLNLKSFAKLVFEKKNYVELETLKVKDIMSKNVLSISSKFTIWEAITLMVKHGVNRLPVVEDGKLVGIISRADIIKALSTKIAHAKISEAEGKEVRTEVDKLLELVKEKVKIDIPLAAKELKLSEQKVEEWGQVLDKHGLLEFRYPDNPLGKPFLRKKDEKG